MSIPFAFVTLITSDAYLPGALTVAAALKDVHLSLPLDQTVGYETVCLVTPETLDVTTIRLLRKAFNVVVGVETIVPPDTEPLKLLGRTDLDAALTKLHVFRLTQYSKVIFLDADVLPLRPLSHLFHIDQEFSAAPDVGWPDIFNSGVMVLSPGDDKFNQLLSLLSSKGTWDGADQGLLNEWRGSDWNRLSFTYNTTPTAVYTYAPAYKRFGPQIAVIHFIGPHKPWHSIAYRAAGSSAQSTYMDMQSFTDTSAVQQPAYDYGSLVDRWFYIYDQHYRSQATEPVFQPNRYASVWNEEGLRRAMVASGALGLEELRRAALEGMEALGISMPRASGEGEYRTMPLEGRFDLIRPRTRAERKHEQAPEDGPETPKSAPVPAPATAPSTPPAQIVSLPMGSPVRWTTLPTPEIHEIPPAPHTRLLSLPPTPLRFVATPYKHQRKTREAGAQTVTIQTPQQQLRGVHSPQTRLTSSPPVEALSDGVSAGSTDTYFPKVWNIDRNRSPISPLSSETSSTTVDPSPLKSQQSPVVFFGQSHIPVTPEMPQRHDKYRGAVGGEQDSPTPDPRKVKRIFPWEEQLRRAPGRVFPDEASPAPFTVLSHSPISATPIKRGTFRSPMPSPLTGFPPSLRAQYPPDADDLFSQKRAEKIPWSGPSPSPLGLGNGLDRVETSSADADVEDEVDSEEETARRSQTRNSSVGTPMRHIKYRSTGVQTDPRELREEGVQATPAPVVEVTETPGLNKKHLRRARLPSTGAASPSTLATTHAPSSPLSRPALDFNDSPLPSRSCDHDRPSPGPSHPFSSSVVSPSPGGGSSLSRIRKGSRVWDPARGVETFKQGSEEILAKFMKIGSWEERA